MAFVEWCAVEIWWRMVERGEHIPSICGASYILLYICDGEKKEDAGDVTGKSQVGMKYIMSSKGCLNSLL